MQQVARFNLPRWLVTVLFLLFAVAIVGNRKGLERLHYQYKRTRYLERREAASSWNLYRQAFNKKARTASRVFAGASKVESFKIIPALNVSNHMELGRIGGYPYSARSLAGDASFARRLESIVLDANSYTRTAKSCSFSPTVAFRVKNGRDSVVVVVCFGCNQLMILEKNAPLKKIGTMKGRFKVVGEFDLFRPELLELAKESFPENPDIQALHTYDTGRTGL